MKARRYNKGKTRYELIPPNALKALADVYTLGAHKYSIYKDTDGNLIKGTEFPFDEAYKYEIIDDGANNWKKGLSWTGALDSVLRHIEAFRKGEDIDELGTYHLANAAWGLFSIMEYYKIAPQFDDRDHKYLKTPKIGLDIDEVLCDWLGGWIEKRDIKERPHSWLFDRHISKEFDVMEEEGTLFEFMLSLKPLISPKDLPFEPHCYITARRIPNEISEQWLDMHGFPTAPVYTVKPNTSKVEIAREAGLDIFVDDNYKNFVEMNNGGICTYLYDAPHNRRYDVGHKRIYSLKELI